MSTAARELPTTAASAHDAQPSLLARYGTLADVRHAIHALEAHGVDGDQTALAGETGAHLSGHTEVRRADRRFLANTAHVEEVLRAMHPLERVRDPDIRTVHPPRATATEPPVEDRE